MKSKSERVKTIIDELYVGNRAKFAAAIGVAANTIYSWEKRNTLDYDLIYTALREKGLSATWLLTGEGEMIEQPSTAPDYSRELELQRLLIEQQTQVIRSQQQIIDRQEFLLGILDRQKPSDNA